MNLVNVELKKQIKTEDIGNTGKAAEKELIFQLRLEILTRLTVAQSFQHFVLF